MCRLTFVAELFGPQEVIKNTQRVSNSQGATGAQKDGGEGVGRGGSRRGEGQGGGGKSDKTTCAYFHSKTNGKTKEIMTLLFSGRFDISRLLTTHRT